MLMYFIICDIILYSYDVILCFGGRALRILGIDPGYATIGYGVVDYDKNRFKTVGFGAFTTAAGIPFPKRLFLNPTAISHSSVLKPKSLLA